MLAVDVRPDGNSPSSLGKIETCASHDVGDEFTVDLIVNNVSDLRTFELRVEYDEDILSVVGADFNQFLISTPPNGSIFPALQEVERPGRYFLAAVEVQGSADSGSGVIARVTFEALDDGVSPIEIAGSSPFGPRLVQSGGGAVEDSDGDGIWDATIVGSTVNIGDDCSTTPVVTLKPTPKPTPVGQTQSPRPSAPAGTATATPPPGSGETIDPDSSQPVASDSNNGSTPGSSEQPSSTAGELATSTRQAGVGNGGPGLESTGSGDGDSGGIGGPWLILGGLVAAMLVSAGGGLYVFSRRS